MKIPIKGQEDYFDSIDFFVCHHQAMLKMNITAENTVKDSF